MVQQLSHIISQIIRDREKTNFADQHRDEDEDIMLREPNKLKLHELAT